MHLNVADRNAGKALFHELRAAGTIGKNAEHFLLGNRNVGLVEGAHLHQVANHGNGVFPHNEVGSHFLHV